MATPIVSLRKRYSGRLLSLRLETVRLTDGRLHTREIVEHPGAAAIIPLISPNKLVLVKQWRPAVGEMLFEIPAGTIENGEDAAACARRELVEETGLEAENLEELFECYVAPGYSTERIVFFKATSLSKKTVQSRPDEEVEPCEFTLEEAVELVRDGRIKDAKTVSGILFLVDWMKLQERCL